MVEHILIDIDKRKFKKTASGSLLVVRESVILSLEQNKEIYKFEENSEAENNHVIGLTVVEPFDSFNRASDQLDTNAGLDVFRNAYLDLRYNKEIYYNRIPLTEILKCNDNGRAYRAILPNKINLSKSELYIAKPDLIQPKTVIEFGVFFIEML